MTTTMRDPVSRDLRKTLRALKLGQMLATLPDRLTLARQQATETKTSVRADTASFAAARSLGSGWLGP